VRVPRVAFFTDTFDQINGVALTSRQFVEFAERNQHEFLTVREGDATQLYHDGAITHVELRRGFFSFHLDRNLRYDLLLSRHMKLVRDAIVRFRPDVIHVVSPGDVGTLGVRIARELGIRLALSWHTNLHEFGARRLEKLTRWLPRSTRKALAATAERNILEACLAFYRLGDVLYAPNEELVALLRQRTGKPVFLMQRGIDTDQFHPNRRKASDGILRIGYVGRITPEKNVRFLRDLEIALQAGGAPPFRFVIVGDGSEKGWLVRNLRNAEFLGVRRSVQLAQAYADMDVFAFPSRTDTFGNVVLEAFGSGTPAVVTDAGGPRFIVRDGETGIIARSDEEFAAATLRLLTDAPLRARMSEAARRYALSQSWDEVFCNVYDGYLAVQAPA
jgi:glycosyltransferase involved in cell wall biosynthesis